MFLPRCSCVFGPTLAVKPAFIADADAFAVVSFGVRSCFFERTGGFDVAVLADVEVIARPVESASAVAGVEVVFCKVLVFAGGGAVDDDEVDGSHGLHRVSVFGVLLSSTLRREHSFFKHCRAAACASCSFSEKISVCISFTRALRSK